MSYKLILIFVLIGQILSAPLLSDQDEWANFKAKYNKNYASPEEEQQRFGIFQENLKRIKEHNENYERGLVTYIQGVNKFADLTHEEFKTHFTGRLNYNN